MTVEVVGGEVQEDGHVRPEGVRPFELEAGDLEHESGRVGRAVHDPGDGLADVAAHAHVPARLAQHRAQGRRRRGLALGARDRGHRALQQAEAQLELGHHRYARGVRGPQLGHGGRDARRHHDHRGARERLHPVAAEFQPHALLLQVQDLRRELPRPLPVGGHDLRPPPRAERSGRDPRPRHPDHHDLFALQFQGALKRSRSWRCSSCDLRRS
jgi:hypothetical protein